MAVTRRPYRDRGADRAARGRRRRARARSRRRASRAPAHAARAGRRARARLRRPATRRHHLGPRSADRDDRADLAAPRSTAAGRPRLGVPAADPLERIIRDAVADARRPQAMKASETCPKGTFSTVTTSPGSTQCVCTTLPSSTIEPAGRPDRACGAVDEPDERRERVAEDVGADARADLLVVHAHRGRDGAQVELAPRHVLAPEHAARAEEVVGRQRGRAERAPVLVAVVDDLDRSAHAGDRGARRRAVARLVAAHEVAPEPHRELALDARAARTRRAAPRRAGVHLARRGCDRRRARRMPRYRCIVAVVQPIFQPACCPNAGASSTCSAACTSYGLGRVARRVVGGEPGEGAAAQPVLREQRRGALDPPSRVVGGRHGEDRINQTIGVRRRT